MQLLILNSFNRSGCTGNEILKVFLKMECTKQLNQKREQFIQEFTRKSKFETDRKKYVNHKFTKILDENGTKHQLTAPYNPQQRDLAVISINVEKAWAILAKANLTIESAATAFYFINGVPTSSTMKTPYEIYL